MPPTSQNKAKSSAARNFRGAPRTLFQEPPKTVYLIRHGESIGQTKPARIRTRDESLRDCGLTAQGQYQADVLPSILGLDRYRKIDCVFSSPLTRALQTAVSGFPSKSIFIVYDLMEIGNRKSPIPENQGRPMKDVIADTGGEDRIHEHTFAPAKPFPDSHHNVPASVRKNKLKSVWSTLYEFCDQRDYKAIAVVCHSTVIRTSLESRDLRPGNGLPIECQLHQDGRLEMLNILCNQVQELSVKIADIKRRNKWLLSNSEDDDDDTEIGESTCMDTDDDETRVTGEHSLETIDSIESTES